MNFRIWLAPYREHYKYRPGYYYYYLLTYLLTYLLIEEKAVAGCADDDDADSRVATSRCSIASTTLDKPGNETSASAAAAAALDDAVRPSPSPQSSHQRQPVFLPSSVFGRPSPALQPRRDSPPRHHDDLDTPPPPPRCG